MPDKYFDVSGVATLVHHRGDSTLPGAPPCLTSGPPILFFHDAGGNGNCFRQLMDCLEPSYSPISFDQPGHGRSGGLDSLDSVEAMAQHAENLVQSWNLDQPILVGEGMGAAVAIEIASRSAINAKGLVCFGAVGRSVDLTQEISELALIASGKARRQFDSTGYSPDTEEGVFRTAFGEWVKTDPRATLGARRAQEKWNADADVSQLQVPVLVVIGEHTEPEFCETAEGLVGELANSSTQQLPGAARRGAIEKPFELSDIINNFAQDLDGTE